PDVGGDPVRRHDVGQVPVALAILESPLERSENQESPGAQEEQPSKGRRRDHGPGHAVPVAMIAALRRRAKGSRCRDLTGTRDTAQPSAVFAGCRMSRVFACAVVLAAVTACGQTNEQFDLRLREMAGTDERGLLGSMGRIPDNSYQLDD